MFKKLILFLTVTTFLLGTAAVAKSWRVSGAIVHMRQGEYPAAIELLEQEVAEKPDDAEAWAYLANAAANVGNFVLATEAWSRAEDLYTQKEKNKELKKIEVDRMFFWDKAAAPGRSKLSRALKFGSAEFQPEEGETRLGDLEAAVSAFVVAYHVFDGHPVTLFWMGLCYDVLQEEYSALPAEESRKVLDYDLKTGASAERDVVAGEYVQDLKRKSLDVYALAVEVKKEDLNRPEGERYDKTMAFNDYLKKLANAAVHLKEYERALAVIDPILAETPDDVELLKVKAAILENQDKKAEAASALEKVAALLEPGKEKADTLWRIGAIYLLEEFENRDPNKAIEVLEQAEKIEPENYLVLIYLGKAYVEIGEAAKGADYLKRGNDLYKKANPGG